MIISLTNEQNLSPDALYLKLLRHARIVIARHKWGATEIALDKYLKTECNSSLKDVCMLILFHTKISFNTQNEPALLFTDPRYEKMARLITYGTGKVSGSRILIDALKI